MERDARKSEIWMIFAALATPLFGKIALHGNKVWHRKFYNDFEHLRIEYKVPTNRERRYNRVRRYSFSRYSTWTRKGIVKRWVNSLQPLDWINVMCKHAMHMLCGARLTMHHTWWCTICASRCGKMRHAAARCSTLAARCSNCYVQTFSSEI